MRVIYVPAQAEALGSINMWIQKRPGEMPGLCKFENCDSD